MSEKQSITLLCELTDDDTLELIQLPDSKIEVVVGCSDNYSAVILGVEKAVQLCDWLTQALS